MLIYGCETDIRKTGLAAGPSVTPTGPSVTPQPSCTNKCSTVGSTVCGGDGNLDTCVTARDGCLYWREEDCLNGCQDGKCIGCTDTDGGLTPWLKGTTTNLTSTGQDWCTNIPYSELTSCLSKGGSPDVCYHDPTYKVESCFGNDCGRIEYYCYGQRTSPLYISCPFGCLDGVCFDLTPNPIIKDFITIMAGACGDTCNESDGGENYYKYGTVKTFSDYYDGWCLFGYDVCLDEYTLAEVVCGPSPENRLGYNTIHYNCQYGCLQGKCSQRGSSPNNQCLETDYGEEYYIKGNLEKDGVIEEDDCRFENRLIEYSCELDESRLDPNIIDYSVLDSGYYRIEYDCPLSCEDGACCPCVSGCQDSSCTDTDEGLFYYEKGILKNNGATVEDYCAKDRATGTYIDINRLIEYSCCLREPPVNPNILDYSVSGLGYFEIEYFCPGECRDGVCVNICLGDTDGGENYYLKGYFHGEDGATEEDYCRKDVTDDEMFINTLVEHTCEIFNRADPNIVFAAWDIVWYNCPNGCQDGACIRDICTTDSDGGENYYEKGRISRREDYCYVGSPDDDSERFNSLREYSCILNKNPLDPNIIGYEFNSGVYSIDYDCDCQYGACIPVELRDPEPPPSSSWGFITSSELEESWGLIEDGSQIQTITLQTDFWLIT